MITKSTFCCEKCLMEFQHEFQCSEHEKECGVLHKHYCDKCGKLTEYSKDDNHPEWYLKNECWTLTPNHYRAGYGSKMDGSEFVLELCDGCLCEFIHSCKNADALLNSGSNTYYEYPESAVNDKYDNYYLDENSFLTD